MNKEQARQLIKATFENKFDKNQFSRFVRNLLNHIEDAPFIYQGNYIPEKFRQYIKRLERIGKYSDGEHTLDILIITLQKESSLERARTMQRNFIAWYLNGSRGGAMKDAALVAYVSPDQTDWRFSLVKMDYKFEKTQTGKMKVKEEFTPARRWSFLVGANEKSHTAQSRLVNILADDEHAPTLAELEEAFNIETVTKEFFLKYRELFIRTKEALDKVVMQASSLKADFDAKGVDTVNFAKKLLGQIVFLYFLQKKGWFGVGRDDDWGTGSKQFLRELFEGKHGRYQNFFNDILEPLFYEALRIDRSHDDHYYSRFNCKIPFLNGGLFDPIGNYDWVHTDINLPNDLFSNTRKTKESDIGDGILDVFDRYNFTVREDEPLEKEVAIDPELLGKAYEKFNAIRPDNFDEYVKALKSGRKGEENKFNKKFGVYYTPREIVHYMCKQSLINYLHTKVTQASLPEEITLQDIEDLIEVGEMITEHEATALIKEQNIKNGIQKSSEYTGLLSDGIRQNAKIIDEWLADITVCDPAVGSGAFPVGMMTEIVRARNVLSVFLKDDGRNDYEFKRRCIEHSLYGVDIDPGAVEIAKLRLWLSLVVDEEDIKNIKPLPNLDYRIVCGNSLLGVEKNLFNYQLFNDIEKLKPLFFSETNPTKKQQYKNKIDDLISQITNGHTEFDFEVYFSEVFHNKGGFDVVIGNPPYVSSKELENKNFYRKFFKTAKGQFDLFTLFIERALSITKPKMVHSFIIPDSFLGRSTFVVSREFLLTNSTILKLLHFNKVFENANVSSLIYVVIKNTLNLPAYKTEYTKSDTIKSWLFSNSAVVTFAQERVFAIPDFKILHLTDKEWELINSLLQKPRLASICDFWRGEELGKSSSILLSSPTNEVLPIVSGENIEHYTFKGHFKYIRKKDVQKNLTNYKKLKIVVRQLGDRIHATLDKSGYVNTQSVYNIISRQDLRLLLGIINSKLVAFLYQNLFKEKKEFPRILLENLKALPLFIPFSEVNNLPISQFNSTTQQALVRLVDRILAITKDDDYLQNPQKQTKVKKLQQEIDQLVYQLYGLTEEEIRIVEGEEK